jgi:hypothetical protein
MAVFICPQVFWELVMLSHVNPAPSAKKTSKQKMSTGYIFSKKPSIEIGSSGIHSRGTALNSL